MKKLLIAVIAILMLTTSLSCSPKDDYIETNKDLKDIEFDSNLLSETLDRKMKADSLEKIHNYRLDSIRVMARYRKLEERAISNRIVDSLKAIPPDTIHPTKMKALNLEIILERIKLQNEQLRRTLPKDSSGG